MTPWYGSYRALPCDPRPPASETCGWCLMPGGTLPFLWVVPYAGRNPQGKGWGPPQPRRNGRRGPVGAALRGHAPLRGLHGTVMYTD